MISQRSRYALKALINLAKLPQGEAKSTRAIADEEQIPAPFLEQIMVDLKRAKLVTSRRGKEGGYTLDRRPEDMTLASILRQVDGPVAPLPCLSRTAYRRCDDCRDESHCSLRSILSDSHKAMLEVLEKRTLAEALARALEGQGAPDDSPHSFYQGAFI